jgi:prepilin-type processing-associated H-X9-DG protein
LPAVQKVREAALRTRCYNNLKQIGLALHSFHENRGRFPPGFVSASATIDGPGTGPGWGWAAHILPYLEQDTLYRSIDFSKDIRDPANAAARTRSVPIFLCPSDSPPSLTFTVVEDGGGALCNVAFANYVGVGGTHEVTAYPDTSGGVQYQGILLRNSRIRMEDIHDGTSFSLCVVERCSRRSPMTTWVGAVTGAGVPPINLNYEIEGPPVLVLTNTGEPGDGRVPNNIFDHVEDASSLHPLGVNCLFADGSVRPIGNTIRPTTWTAIGTRAGGEIIDEGW